MSLHTRQSLRFGELKQFLSQLKDKSFRSIDRSVRDLCRNQIAYTEHTGDAGFLAYTFGQIGEAILRMSPRQQGAGLVRELVCAALRWEPWNDYLRTLWARAFLAQDAHEAAEWVYWDTIRRFPRNAYARNQLVGLLRRLEGRKWEAIELARESAALFPRNEVTQNVLANVLLGSDEPATHKEAINLLIRALHRAPNYDAHINLLGGTLAADFKTASNVAEACRDIVARLPNEPKLHGRIGQVIWKQADGLRLAESFFRASVARFDANAGPRNQLAKVLVANGATEKRDEAIRILRDTLKSDSTNQHSLNQLAETLAASGDPDELKEAIGILEATTQDELTDNTFSRELLARLTGAAPGPSQGAEPPASGPWIDETEEDLGAVDMSAQVQHPLPAELSDLARMRRLRFRLTHSQGANKDAALNELRETLETDSTFAYAQLLAVRQGVWTKDSDTLPSFPAAFELALQDEDAVALARLAKQYPRLEALTLVARAIFGDADAARLVQATLDSPDQAKAGIEKMLKKRFGQFLFVVVDGRSAAMRSRERVIAALRDINEWAIGDGDWRVDF